MVSALPSGNPTGLGRPLLASSAQTCPRSYPPAHVPSTCRFASAKGRCGRSSTARRTSVSHPSQRAPTSLTRRTPVALGDPFPGPRDRLVIGVHEPFSNFLARVDADMHLEQAKREPATGVDLRKAGRYPDQPDECARGTSPAGLKPKRRVVVLDALALHFFDPARAIHGLALGAGEAPGIPAVGPVRRIQPMRL